MKDSLEALSQIQDRHLIFVLTICSLIAPTTIAMLIFFGNFFSTLNLFALAILIISCGFISALPSFITAMERTYDEERGGSWGLTVLAMISGSLSIIYVFLELLYYMFFMDLGFKPFLLITMVISVIISPSVIILITKKKSA